MASVFVDLPDVKLVDDSADSILQDMITIYQAVTGRTLNPADPERLFLLALAQYMMAIMTKINQAKYADLLPYARGPMLDLLGVFFKTPRLQASPAITTVRFTLSIPLATAQTIPAGTRVAPQGGDGSLYFAAPETVIIPPGATFIDVPMKCVTAGTVGNDFLPGQINTLIDPLPFIKNVSNLTASAGGANVEDDDPYRERIALAPESFSVAGPEGAYEYWAKTASPAIIDVAAVSPSAVQVTVVPLLEGGELPTQDILDAVAAVLNGRTIRPLTDKVTVQAPEPVNYDIDLTYYIRQEDAANSTTIQKAVEQAVKDFALWQRSKLGRAIVQSQLVARVIQAGASRAEVNTPADYTPVSKLQVAQEKKVNVSFGGVSDD